MIRQRLRKFRRRIVGSLVTALSGLAGRGGPARIRRIGQLIGEAHYWLAWPSHRRLRRDIACALNISRSQAGSVLRQAHRDNDRAAFEIVSLAHPDCEPQRLVDSVIIDRMNTLRGAAGDGRGTIVLGMHMGNGILMAAGLARAGFPVHVVFRDPRRLEPGMLARSLERVGCVPVPLDRTNPTRSFRRMLKILTGGGLLYVLMDQANKGEGAERRFLGKTLRMPIGIPALAIRSGAPVIPVHCESALAGWQYLVHPPLTAETTDTMLDEMISSMQRQIIRRPALWAWHHRRWRRYHFDS